MKRSGFILTAILFTALSATCQSQMPQPPKPKYYDYISIVVWGETPNIIYVSMNGYAYKKIKIFDKVKGDYDYNQAFNLVNQYEQDGYELYANNFIPHAYVNPGTNYFLLRKEHKDEDKDKDKEKDKDKASARSARE